MRHNITQAEAPERIRNLQPFSASALSGVEGRAGTGDLPAELAELYRDHAHNPSIDYTVLSYRTPIAWHCDGTWYEVVPRFSVTTSQHQGTVRAALAGHARQWWGTWVDGEYVDNPDKPRDLYASDEVVRVGDDERAVPVGHYQGVGPGYYA